MLSKWWCWVLSSVQIICFCLILYAFSVNHLKLDSTLLCLPDKHQLLYVKKIGHSNVQHFWNFFMEIFDDTLRIFRLIHWFSSNVLRESHMSVNRFLARAHKCLIFLSNQDRKWYSIKHECMHIAREEIIIMMLTCWLYRQSFATVEYLVCNWPPHIMYITWLGLVWFLCFINFNIYRYRC